MLNLDKAVYYHDGQFPPKDMDYSQFINQLLGATSALARYDQMLKNMHNSEILLAPLRSQEAVISSRMEGTISTIDEILKYEADYENEENTGLVRSDVIETILYQRALKTAQKMMEEGYPLSQSLIKQTHQLLLSFGRGALKSPGQFKNEQNYLADRFKQNILFVPISPEKLTDGMDDLFKYINEDSSPALIKTAVAHVEFEALHPFKDGNGRIGRMIITLMLWSSGQISSPHFYISGYLEENKDLYIDTMRNVSANNDWASWCSFFLKATESQAIKNLEIANNIKDLYEDMKMELSTLLASKWSAQVLDFLFTHPFFRNNKFTQNSGIPAATANKITRILVENDILKVHEEASGRRAAMYSFERLLEKVRV